MVTGPYIVLDAHALSLLASEDRKMLNWIRLAQVSDAVFRISTITLTEVMDGSGRDARVFNALRKHVVQEIPGSAKIARAAGLLRSGVKRKKPRDLTIDAIIAATALSLSGPTVVVTSDPGDLKALLAGTVLSVKAINEI